MPFERLVQAGDERLALLERLALEAELEGQLPGLEGQEAGGRVHVFLEDALGRLGGDLLDLDAALGRGHDDGRFAGPVDDEAEVELPGDVQRLLDEDALDPLALGAGLVGHELHADHRGRQGLGLGGRRRELDAAALAPAAGVDLGLDDDPRPDPLGDRPGRRRRSATSPRGTRTPNLARICLAWYSWIFILLSLFSPMKTPGAPGHSL